MTTATLATSPTTAVTGDSPPAPTEEAQPARRLFTVDEYMAMVHAGILRKEERIELLDGEIIHMAPIGNPHTFSVNSLNMLLTPAMVGQAIVQVQGQVTLNDISMPQPDLVVLRQRDNYYVEGASSDDILLLIEVADSSLAFDSGRKAARYAAAGISEYWIANLRTGEVIVHTEPTDNDGYASIHTVPAGGALSPQAFPDLTLSLADYMPPIAPDTETA